MLLLVQDPWQMPIEIQEFLLQQLPILNKYKFLKRKKKRRKNWIGDSQSIFWIWIKNPGWLEIIRIRIWIQIWWIQIRIWIQNDSNHAQPWIQLHVKTALGKKKNGKIGKSLFVATFRTKKVFTQFIRMGEAVKQETENRI